MMKTNVWFTAILAWLFIFGFSNSGFTATIISTLMLVIFSLKTAIQRKRYNNSDFDSDRLKNIEQNMREPKGIEISPYEERIRRNLLVVSFFALAFICLDLQISSDSKFLGGMTFSNLTENKVYILLFVIIGYEFIHYLWNLKTSFMHWRIRLTGISHAEARGNRGTGFSSKNISPYDFSGTDENSNLYVWMFESQHDRKETMKRLSQTSSHLKKSLQEINNWKKIQMIVIYTNQ